MYFDVHSHLFDEKFDNDRNQLISACKKKRINVFTAGIDYNTNEECLELSQQFDNVYSCLGMFPDNSFNPEVLEQIRKNKNNIIGIGEVGLDFKYSNHEGQRIVFQKIMGLAQELNLPLIVHSRNAHIEVLEMVENINVPVVLHAFFTSRKNVLHASSFFNVFFSVPASVVYSEQFQWLVKNVNINKLLCETDSPYLWKYGRNTPLNIVEVYKKIGEVKQLSLREVERIIERNVHKIFRV